MNQLSKICRVSNIYIYMIIIILEREREREREGGREGGREGERAREREAAFNSSRNDKLENATALGLAYPAARRYNT